MKCVTRSMRTFSRHATLAWVVIGCAVIACGGCGRNSNPARLVPSTSVARGAIETVFAAWQRGDRPGVTSQGSPAIQMVDSLRESGSTLVKYEILAEASGDGPTRFSVRLQLDKPSREMELKYVVVGQDPIWVFREEEYERSQGM
jgi:hypothetical protein